MTRASRFAAVLCSIVTLATGGFVRAASAATTPANDTIGGATVVKTLPLTQTLDTTGATTDADDAQVNQTCGAPATNNSVWFEYTAGPTDSLLAVDTSGSNFSSGVIIATGAPGALTTQSCNPVSAAVATTPGTTYHILVFDDTGAGGRLRISIHGQGPVPRNDKLAGATTVQALPFKATLDTTGATTDGIDTKVNATCGAPSTSHSVWYKYTPAATDKGVFFDAGASTFAAGVIVARMEAGALTTLACGPSSVSTAVTPGTTYYIMVFDGAGGVGGTLNLTIDRLPTASATVRYRTLIDSSGVATLTGSYSCSNGGTRPFSDIGGQLVQVVGDVRVVTGAADPGPFQPTCDGKNHAWTISIAPSPGTDRFRAGKAAALTTSSLCNDSACTFSRQNVVVNLARTPAGSKGAAPVTSSNTHTSPRVARPTWGNASHTDANAWRH